jgi:hypothetical protein
VYVVHSVFEMDLETAAGVSAAFVASVSTARYRLSDVFHLEWDTRTRPPEGLSPRRGERA